jgi:uncharacterized protein YjdB
MLSRTVLRSLFGIFAVGAAACSGRDTTMVQPGDRSSSRTPLAGSITVAIDSSGLTLGDTAQARATLRDSFGSVLTGRTILWTSEDPLIASVSARGMVTAQARGTTGIVASYGTASGSASIAVASAVTAVPVHMVAVTIAARSLAVGQTTQAAATPRDSTGAPLSGRAIAWSSSKPTVASVSPSGLVTSVSVGSANIIGTSETRSGSASIAVTPTRALPAFQDSFESGARAAVQGGYKWTEYNSAVSVSSAKAFSGTHSLEFVYGPDALTAADDSDAEQRFHFGAYLTEVWVEYMLYVPSNYFHRAVLGVGDTFNNKFISFWRDDYVSATDFRIRIEDYPNGGGGVFPSSRPLVRSVGSSSIRPVSTTSTSAGGSFDIGGAQVAPPAPDRNFISPSGPIKVGDWTQIRVHVKAASGLKTNDGVLELWANGSIVFRKNNGDLIGPSGNRELHNGYLFGWANSGFTQKTVMNIDDFKIYASNPGWAP